MGFSVTDKLDEANSLDVNAWNWRPTLALLERFAVLPEDELERMGFNGGGGEATVDQARVIAGKLEELLEGLRKDERVRLDLSVTDEPDDGTFYRDDLTKNYSATREWLEQFAGFCRTCNGFYVT